MSDTGHFRLNPGLTEVLMCGCSSGHGEVHYCSRHAPIRLMVEEVFDAENPQRQ